MGHGLLLTTDSGHTHLMYISWQFMESILDLKKKKKFKQMWQTINTDYAHRYKIIIQSILLISKSKGLFEIVQDIHTLTYQICRIEENNKSNNHISQMNM